MGEEKEEMEDVKTLLINTFAKQGFSILLLAIGFYIMFTQFNETKTKLYEEMSKVRKESEAAREEVRQCNQYSRQMMEKTIQENITVMREVSQSMKER